MALVSKWFEKLKRDPKKRAAILALKKIDAKTYTKWVEFSILVLISWLFLLKSFNPMTIFTFMGTFCRVMRSTSDSNIPRFCVFLSPKWTLLMVGKCLDCKEFIKLKLESRSSTHLLTKYLSLCPVDLRWFLARSTVSTGSFLTLMSASQSRQQ